MHIIKDALLSESPRLESHMSARSSLAVLNPVQQVEEVGDEEE